MSPHKDWLGQNRLQTFQFPHLGMIFRSLPIPDFGNAFFPPRSGFLGSSQSCRVVDCNDFEMIFKIQDHLKEIPNISKENSRRGQRLVSFIVESFA